jgi:molecular chaperone HscB
MRDVVYGVMVYYEAFGLEPRLTLDVEDLQQRFYRLSREYHPDRFTRRPAEEQQQALERTSVLNDGLRILKDPIRRAEYVLKANGFDIGEQRTKDVPPELLEEVFELNMALEESDKDQLAAFQTRFEAMRNQIDHELMALFKQYDAAPSQDTLTPIRAILNRRRYIDNLIQKIS